MPTRIYNTQILLGGDIILEMLGITVKNTTETFKQIRAKLASLKQGDKVTAKVLRSGKILTLSTDILKKQ
ncbi:MAG: S1C family serine protease [gamma proteobacterium symbiont of Lucinoma myriamae]|nr:S1C family serine protease [gamma proteobacterium symbiont of Lucinoma myriamae]